MKCPLLNNPREGYIELGDCYKEKCQWWNSKGNFNPDTKQFEGECCILTLSKLKISGGINTHVN